MNELSTTDVPSEIATRITAAADQLYEEAGRISFPNVDTVRRKARVNMNDASSVMRIWRRAQKASIPSLSVPIPEAVQAAGQSMLSALWTTASETANASLQAAQVGWESERAEAEACRQQLASAFDKQSEELALAQHRVFTLDQKLATQDSELQATLEVAEQLRQAAAASETKAATTEARAFEITKRADDLKVALTRAYATADQERLDAKNRLDVAEATIDSLRNELRQRSTLESSVREELARMRGLVDAMNVERDALIAERHEKPSRPAKRAAAKSKSPNGGVN